jgi:hypothetical protein
VCLGYKGNNKSLHNASLSEHDVSLNHVGALRKHGGVSNKPMVNSVMKAKNVFYWFLGIILWLPVIFFSLLLTHNAILYFTHGGEYGILPEKILARQDLIWNICFYVHLPAGIICLLAPLFLFARRFMKKAFALHVIVGKIYVWTTLIIVCPTGMYLAFYAKGGVITQAGFMIQGILLAAFTWAGYRAILKGDKIAHLQNMIRSYAVATVVLTFRIFHIMFFLLRVPYQDNYAISQWLGMAINLLVAEICVVLISNKIKNSHHLKLTTS